MVIVNLQPSPHLTGCYHFVFILLLFNFAVSPSQHHQQQQLSCDRADHDSLLSFSNSFDSLNWSSSSSSNCCSWDGITCDSNGRVSSLILHNMNLKGEISPSLTQLVALSHNQLSGPLPDGLFLSLSMLVFIDLSFNRLSLNFSSSSIHWPPTLRSLDISSNQFHGQLHLGLFQSNLISLNASNNLFSGQLPDSICLRCPLLRDIDLSSNNLIGGIPPGIGGCSWLEIFRAGFNSLSGTLPDGIYSLKALRELSVPANYLQGSLDERIASLTNLTIIELFFNDFQGTIPRYIGNLTRLERLQLHINRFNGSIPPSLLTCKNLVKLILRVNLLNGDLSNLDFSRLVNLQVLDLGNNYFTGRLPESIYSCNSITAIRVATNKLTGEISPNIAALQSLSFLSLSNNSFTNISGAIRILSGCNKLTTLTLSVNFFDEVLPSDANFIAHSGFPSLQVLSFGGCFLFGQVPSWIGNLRKLQVLDLSFNRIQGTIPDWFGNMPTLFYLDLGNNLINGEFPVELTKMPALLSPKYVAALNHSYFELPVFVAPNNAIKYQYNKLASLPPAIYLRNNNIRGPIPVEVGNLQSLHVLDLNGNQFSGTIPSQLSNLTQLEVLNLSNNSLTGEIPVSLKGLNFLSSFNVSYNDLEGPIPIGGQMDTFPESSFQGNERLCGGVVMRPCSGERDPGTSTVGSQPEQDQMWDKELFYNGFATGLGSGFGLVVIISASYLYSTLCFCRKERNHSRVRPNHL